MAKHKKWLSPSSSAILTIAAPGVTVIRSNDASLRVATNTSKSSYTISSRMRTGTGILVMVEVKVRVRVTAV